MSQAIKEALKRASDELLELADAAGVAPLTDEQSTRVAELRASIKDLKDREALLAEAEGLRAKADEPKAEARSIEEVVKTPSAPVRAEARSAYVAENRAASWFQDRATLANPDASNADVEEARGRLAAHYDASGDEGAARHVRTYSAGVTTEGGYLVAPQYLQSEFADLLAAGRPTADLVGKMGLPASGKTFYIPTQDGATSVAVHTENNSLDETTATFSQIQVDACRVGGTATMPNWLVDRSFPGADQIVLRDLAKRYAVKVNDIVLNSSTSNRKGLLQESGLGAATATAGTATIAEVWPALLNAVADVSSGVYAYPDAIVMHPRRWAWLAGQLDQSDRPVIGSLNPQNAVASYGGMSVAGQFQGPIPVGNILGIPVYLDAGIPTNLGAGTDEDRIIVMKRDEPLLMESAPRFAVSTDAEFAKDQMVARVTGDLAFTCARRKGAVSIISGTALNDTI